MERIIIVISQLKKDSWNAIYNFIKCIVTNAELDLKRNALESLRKVSNGIRLNYDENIGTAKDVCVLYGEKNFIVEDLYENICFSIIYKKCDDREDFTELVPFILIQREYGRNVTLGIDICNLKNPNSYKFKCGDFFILHDEHKPILGERSIYFIERIVNKETGEIEKRYTTSFAGKGKSNHSKYQGNISRRFLPLIHINEDNYESLFSTKKEGKSKEFRFVNGGIEKIKDELKKANLSELDTIFERGSLFGQWFEAGYFYSYDKEELLEIRDKLVGIRSTLQIFKNSVHELVQNIIFHGGKNGIIYCVFDKKANVSDNYAHFIPHFNSYKNNQRFLRIGIFDFGENGIVDTFGSGPNVYLSDFFDINSIVTTGLTRLDMRYAAHLGIKTFVKIIADHKGYFRVESCEHNNERKIKKSLHTTSEGNILSGEETVSFANGTHYEIILPVTIGRGQELASIPVQTTSISKEFPQLLKKSYPLRAVKLKITNTEECCMCKDKQSQLVYIERVCKDIINYTNDMTTEIALDLENRYVSPTTIFKIAAYLQLTANKPFEKIILVNVTREFQYEFCSLVDEFLIKHSNGDMPVWSRLCAIVILDGNLHIQIVWGETKDELYYINREIKKLYYNNFLDSSNNENLFDCNYGYIEKECYEAAKKFVLPYDMLIESIEDNKNGEDGVKTLPFLRFLEQILKREIVSKKAGLSVNHKYTYIGKKIIVKNFYEADILFQNNFFVERFAYLIVRKLYKYLPIADIVSGKKKLLLIGYKYYSEFLLKNIQHQLSEFLQKTSQRQLTQHLVSLVICNDDKDYTYTAETFNFNIDDDGDKTKRDIFDNPDKYLFVTIVPIGATLSTNDKIISFFRRLFEIKDTIQKANFIYNYCAILVRDKISNNITHLEAKQKWLNTNNIELYIKTAYQEAQIIHYTIQIAGREKNKSDKGNWIKRLNSSISFPPKWEKEKYVNLTENSSINSQNLMDFPKVFVGKEEVELEHIYKLKDYIYKGHIEILNCHHKIFIDTESFVRKEKAEVSKWLKLCAITEKGREIDAQDVLNVLITPNVECESDFVSMVNNIVFGGNALIIYLDVHRWRNNIAQKLSFLNTIQRISFYYVDHAFFTGNTYTKSKNFIYSIVGDKGVFRSAFTIINRLPYLKEKEIRGDLRENLFAYATLYYPTSKSEEHECELCQLEKYYGELNRRTVLDSCAGIILKNRDKLKLVNLDEIKIKIKNIKDITESNTYGELHRRIFLRLIIGHWLYYMISKVTRSENDFETKKKLVTAELDGIYLSFCDETKADNCLLNQKIEQWYISDNQDFFIKNEKLIHDKKISFLKVISSPPLSQYIAIREYAHNKLLDELFKIINKKDTFGENDLKIIKCVLKSLSFLKSNALVRKDVIIGVWKVLLNVVSLFDEDKRIESIKDFSKDVQFFIKSSIVNDEAKATFLGELLRQGKEMEDFEKIRICKTRLSLSRRNNCNDFVANQDEQNELFCAFNDCKYDIFKREYTSFLVWLFYDNTTIIRNTLSNFSKEIEKSKQIYSFFYENINNEENLKSIEDFRKCVKDIKTIFEKKVEEEYYYSSFYPYLKNGDDIAFVEKLIYVIYAKLKLEDLITKKHKTNIENDTSSLMEIFTSIMGADAAFWTMKKSVNDTGEYLLYPISVYSGNCSKLSEGWRYDQWILKNEFYTSKFYENLKGIKDPLTPLYNVNRNTGEKRHFGIRSLGVFIISDLEKAQKECETMKSISYDNNAVASITFLYGNSNTLTQNEKKFRINFQESSRLLRLLKREIDLYVIDYLIKEKALDIWEEKFKSIRKFEKIYAKQSHVFKAVYGEMDEFDNIQENDIRKLYKTWFFLTNETISFMYSNIEKNVSSDGKRHYLSLVPGYIVDTNNTLGKTFNTNFISFLKALLDYHWNNEEINNEIIINGKRIDNFKLGNSLVDCKIPCNKHLVRTLVAQLLNNSLASENGHRDEYDEKKVYIKISETAIVLKDSYINSSLKKEEKYKIKKSFDTKKSYIKNMRCDEYSSTTLTTLQGVIDYMKERGINSSCEYGFNSYYNFEVEIRFYEK